VDFVLPRGDRALFLVEANASKTVHPQMGNSLVRLANAVSNYDVECVVLHRSSRDGGGFSTLRPGVKTSTLDRFLDRMRKE